MSTRESFFLSNPCDIRVWNKGPTAAPVRQIYHCMTGQNWLSHYNGKTVHHFTILLWCSPKRMHKVAPFSVLPFDCHGILNGLFLTPIEIYCNFIKKLCIKLICSDSVFFSQSNAPNKPFYLSFLCDLFFRNYREKFIETSLEAYY